MLANRRLAACSKNVRHRFPHGSPPTADHSARARSDCDTVLRSTGSALTRCRGGRSLGAPPSVSHRAMALQHGSIGSSTFSILSRIACNMCSTGELFQWRRVSTRLRPTDLTWLRLSPIDPEQSLALVPSPRARTQTFCDSQTLQASRELASSGFARKNEKPAPDA